MPCLKFEQVAISENKLHAQKTGSSEIFRKMKAVIIVFVMAVLAVALA